MTETQRSEVFVTRPSEPLTQLEISLAPVCASVSVFREVAGVDKTIFKAAFDSYELARFRGQFPWFLSTFRVCHWMRD